MNPSGSEKRERGSKRRKGNEPSVPLMSLPEGGGAIRGMGEKFAANPVTGTGSVTAHNRGTSSNFTLCRMQISHGERVYTGRREQPKAALTA